MVSLNYYEILGVSPTASDEEIRKAYRKKALYYHPDKASQNNLTVEKATAAFKEVQAAYEALSNSQERSQYEIDRKRSADKPRPFKSNLFDEAFYSFMRAHSFGSARTFERRSKDESEEDFFPEKISQDIISIIDSNSREILEEFLKSKPCENSLLKTIFYSACRKGKINIVKYLIEVKKLSAHLKVNDGLSFTGPIFKAAAESGNLELVKYLLEVHHVDIESQGLSAGTIDTALSRAALHGHTDVVKYLISKGANLNPKVSNRDILDCAVESKKLSIVTLLVEAGTKIDLFTLGKALEIGSLEIVQYLLQMKPGITAHRFIYSPACSAVKSGNVSLVKHLEKEGLDIFKKYRSWEDDNEIIASLMMAAAESRSIEMMCFLLDERGLNAKVADNLTHIKSILSHAVRNRTCFPEEYAKQASLKFVQFLIETRKFTLPKRTLEFLISDSAEFSGIEMNSYLQSYLYEAEPAKRDVLLTIANEGLNSFNLADLLKLYNNNSKFLKKGKYGDFSFEVHFHIQNRKISIEQLRKYFLENRSMMVDALFYYSSYYYEKDLSPLRLLLELGVDLNSENAEGIAAIHIALNSGGRNKIVQFFIDNKADLSKKNKQGITAAEILR